MSGSARLSCWRSIGLPFITQRTVNHSAGEYVRGGAKGAHANTVEGFYSLLKRNKKGVYQRCGERYLHEFDFKYPNRIALGVDDTTRAKRLIAGAGRKRLRYQGLGRARTA
ncbi:MAG: transposase [Alphaproteobacteria bacterium]